ncbi:MAG: single-stranded DNA-binding protein [Atopobiaceae bacterium]|nr:single-stranded DNA-binding protein [Atopobiaceae bacterium]
MLPACSNSSSTRATASGTTVLQFGVAVNERRRNQRTGEWEDVANFVDCAMFGKRAEALSNILCKGMKVALEGRLRYHAWEADDGSKRSKLDVLVDEVELMGERRESADRMSTGRRAAPSEASDSGIEW